MSQEFILPDKIKRGCGIIACGWCKQRFYQGRKDQKFCSTECRLDYHHASRAIVCCPTCKSEGTALEWHKTN